jgi:hypothetical protein
MERVFLMALRALAWRPARGGSTTATISLLQMFNILFKGKVLGK